MPCLVWGLYRANETVALGTWSRRKVWEEVVDCWLFRMTGRWSVRCNPERAQETCCKPFRDISLGYGESSLQLIRRPIFSWRKILPGERLAGQRSIYLQSTRDCCGDSATSTDASRCCGTCSLSLLRTTRLGDCKSWRLTVAARSIRRQWQPKATQSVGVMLIPPSGFKRPVVRLSLPRLRRTLAPRIFWQLNSTRNR
jgi:hypothetical protein